MTNPDNTTAGIDYLELFRGLPGRYIIFLPDDPRFTIIDATESISDVSALNRSEILNRPFFDAFPDDSEGSLKKNKQFITEAIRKSMRLRRPVTLEAFRYDVHDKKGRLLLKYWKPTFYPVTDTDGRVKYIVHKSLDVTDEHIAELKLRQALAAGKIGTGTWDIEIDRLRADEAFSTLFGISKEQSAKGLPVEDYLKTVHEKDMNIVKASIDNAVHKGDLVETEFRTWVNDQTRWVIIRGQVERDITGHALVLTCVAVDITKRKEAELAFAKQTSMFNMMSDTLTIIMFTAGADGSVNYVNKAWYDYTGLAMENESIPKVGWLRAVHPHDIEETSIRWRRSLKTGEPYEIEQRLKRHDGAYRWHIGRANPILNEKGEIELWFGYSIDVDDLRRAGAKQARLEQITEALKHQRRELMTLNRAKDEFISVASHQLRTPATAVKQYLGMMIDGYVGELDEVQLAMIKTAYESNERQLDTVNDLLHVAQADAGKVVLQKSEENIVALLHDIVKEHRKKFEEKNQKLEFSSDKKEVFCSIDKSRIRMVIENLVDNANKYTPEGKSVHVSCTSTDKLTCVKVTDEGVGIPKKDQSKLFQKFSRIENPLSTQAGGTGLGLYWAHKIVSLHGGDLTVESEPDKGTTFTVNLPIE